MSKEMIEYCEWFLSIFESVIIDEGWNFYVIGHTVYDGELVVRPSGYKYVGPDNKKEVLKYDEEFYKNSKISKYKVNQLAAEYGWVLNDNGDVISFDKEKINKNKHLIEVKELGLL